MKKILLSGIIALATIAGISAQQASYDPVKAPYGHGEDSVKCRQNLSLMQTSAKAENYKDALIPWQEVYKKCPAASINTYIYGPKIFKAFYAAETNEAKKKEYLDQTMEIYDTRLKYFPNNKGTTLAYKTYDYQEMAADKTDQKLVYAWLGEALKEMGADMNPQDAYSYFMVASLNIFLNDLTKKEQYINDYFRVQGLVDEAISKANAAGNTADAEYLGLVKDGIVKGFVASGAGDCKTLTEYYGNKIEPNKTNKEFLSEVINALGSIGCSDSDIYFTAAEHLYRLEPSANAAVGLANRSLKDEDYDTAVKYYQEAAKIETDKSKASDYMMQLAGIFSKQRNYSKARQAAYDALEYNPNNGNAYILIGQLYAASAGSIFSEPEKAGLVFCAAVDKMQKAKSVDPGVAAEANSLMNKYAGYYMSTETAFMMGYKSGDSVFIPGWIGESTTVRLK